MRFLANENFPGKGVQELRTAGHEVFWIRTDSPGIADDVVLARAAREGLVLLTFDKDFGELAWRTRLPKICGRAVPHSHARTG
jgi:predicted nuclease of predicted toxin-antitoxin system